MKKGLEEHCYLCLLITLLSPKSEVLYISQHYALNIIQYSFYTRT